MQAKQSLNCCLSWLKQKGPPFETAPLNTGDSFFKE